MVKLDDTDKDILRYLQQDAKLTTKELASRLNLSPTPVYERIRRLENEGVIKRYVAIVDREKVGKDLMVLCNIRLKEHAREAGEVFVKAIVGMTEVVECLNISEFFISPNRFKYTIFVINEKQNKKHIYPIHGVCRFGELSCVCVL
jgi:Lrp/AsnC family transcriptional regulator, leucine-responsive regulatory protein